MSRVAAGRSPVRVTTQPRPMSESISRGTPTMRLPGITTECSTSLSSDLAALADGGERADVAAGDAGAGADDGRAAHVRVEQLGAGLDDDAALDPARALQLAVDARLERLEHPGVRLEQRVLLAGVEPPALEHLVADGVAVVDQPLDGVGDLELAAPRRLDGGDRLVHERREQVDADEGEVRRRVGRLLDEAHDLAAGAELGDAEALRVGHLAQEDAGRRRVGAAVEGRRVGRAQVGLEALDEAGEATAAAGCRRGT